MRPSPFTGKFKKRDIKLEKDKQEDKQQQPFEQNVKEQDNNTLKPPSSKNLMKIGKSKEKEKSKQKEQDTKKIYEALKDQEEPDKLESKASASFKPNLKLKAGKKIKLSTHQAPAEVKKEQEVEQQQSYRPVLKPTLFRKGQTSERNNKEQVIVEDEQKNHNIEEDSYQGSGSVSQSMSMAPKFKIKQKQETHFPVIQEQTMEQTGFGINNFADIKIETREINLDPSENRVSEVKIEKQQARVRELSKLLNLEIDMYEETLNISCVTPYEIYINKIKSGSLVNSGDQAFDEKSHAGSQTLTFQFQDFTNQCPQDYHTDATNITQKDQSQSFQIFLTKISPVLEQLIKPSTTVVMPPIFLLALRPEFKKLVACPYPVFVYYSGVLRLGIAVIGEKLYIVENQILCVVGVGCFLVAGCRDGGIYLWGGKNDKGSRLYRRILEETQTTNFQLPECSNQELDRFSIYRSESPIISLLAQSNQHFTSLDQTCKLTKWRILRNPNTTNLQPYTSHQFTTILQKPNLIGHDLKKRNEMYFVSCSVGLLVWNGEELVQRLDTEGFRVVGFALPHRTNFVYLGCEDYSVRIYEEHYANQLFKIYLPGLTLADIFVPETQYENKRLSLTSKIYIVTTQGNLYSINLLKNSTQPKILTGNTEKKDRDIIFRGVNKLSNGFELVSLWRDLKCTSQVKKMDINTEPTVANIKNILEDNRQVHNWLESEHSLTIVE